MKRCLFCYQALEQGEPDFHIKCSKKIFGTPIVPELNFHENELDALEDQIVKTYTAVTGVQPKFSLDLRKFPDHQRERFTIVGLWGGYILKPPSITYEQLPEIEDLTMHLASIANINVVPHSLIRLLSGNLAYITKRIDRKKNHKLPMEDMCQITERQSEHKYNGSYEQIAKAIIKYSKTPILDVVNFYEIVLFSFLTGNSDMHLKNFSLITQSNSGPVLSPAYDLVATKIIFKEDEEMALTLNARKNKIMKSDFEAAFQKSNLDLNQQKNIFNKMIKVKNIWLDFIDISFLNKEYKQIYKSIITERFDRLFL